MKLPLQILGLISLGLVACTRQSLPCLPSPNYTQADYRDLGLTYTQKVDTLPEGSGTFLLGQFEHQDTAYWVMMEADTPILNLIRLSDLKLVRQLPWPNLDWQAETYGSLIRFRFFTLDTILYWQEQSLVLGSLERIYHRIPINLHTEKWIRPFWWRYKDLFPMEYDQGLVYAYQYCGECGDWKKPKQWTRPVEGEINLANGQIRSLPVLYPKSFTERNYGFMMDVDRHKQGNRHLYSYPPVPDFCIYYLDLDSMVCNASPSRYEQRPTSTLTDRQWDDSDYKFQHITLENYYGPGVYDPYRRLYYRTFEAALPEKNPDGTYNSMVDKKTILMVYDESLRLVEEINLDLSHFYLNHAWVDEKGLHIPHYQRGRFLLRHLLISPKN